MDNTYFDLRKLKYLGVGAIIGKNVRIRRPEDVIIGDYTIIDDFSYISTAMEIGKYCHIASNVTISGGAAGKLTMGNFCGIATGSSIHVGSSDYINVSLDLPSIPEQYRFGGILEDIILSDHVLLGSHTIVLPGVYLPEGFASTALTVVRKKKYKEWTLYGGYECKKIIARKNSEEYKNRIKENGLTI